MAEQALYAAGFRDMDGDGKLDIINQIQRDSSFGPGKANWTIRRRLTISVITLSYSVCFIMAVIWFVKTLFNHPDIPPNLLNFGTTIFWSFNVTATSLLVAYTGISMADTNSYRKSLVDIATANPAPQAPRRHNYGGYYGGGGYGGNDYYTQDIYAQPPQGGVQPVQPVQPNPPNGPPTHPDPNVIR